MISSPPQEAEQIRGKTLTPESPKPVHYPSPSNIPILEKQMDPMFNEPPLNIGTPASYQVAYQAPHQQTQTPSAQSTTSYYSAEQQAPANYQNAAHGGSGTAPAGQVQTTQYGSGYSAQAQAQDTSIHNFSYNQNQAAAPTLSEANSASAQDYRPTYPVSHDPNSYAAHQNPAQPAVAFPIPGAATYQGLLDALSPAATASNAASERYATPQNPLPSPSLGQPSVSSLPAAPNLPPRPPAQENNQDIRSYHPHSQKTPTGQLQPLDVGAGASTNATTRPSPSTPAYGQRQSIDNAGDEKTGGDEDSRWPPEINKVYEDFLNSERKFVTDGQWDQFPNGSRLFIGNLPTEKVTKRDIFHRFYKHGQLAQISIKQAYGFVQFLEAAACHRALQAEQGQAIRGRKMHLEISKPQRNTKKSENHNNDRNAGARRRSRSPDYSRGGSGQPRNVDRYSSGQNPLSPRDRDNRRFRDDYRYVRSPSPPRGRGIRSRDRSRDRYDGRRRSRSRSPRRYRSPSPRREYDDDLPLPHRDPHQVPDVQVLVINEGLPRDFIRWVEDSFKQQNLRIDVLILSPRLSETSVVRRQIIEGVLAIVRLDTGSLTKGKVNLQVFDRRGGAGNVQFNEYSDLDPNTAAALVVNAKRSASQPVQAPAAPSYGQNYGPPPPTYPPTPQQYSAPQNSNPAFSSLSQLLGAVTNNPQGQASQQPPAGITPDLARLLGSISAPMQGQPFTPSAQPTPSAFPQNFQNPAFSIPGAPGASSVQNSQAQPDMNELMAQLAKYQR